MSEPTKRSTYHGWGGTVIDADHFNDIARKLRTYAEIYTGDKEAKEMADWCDRVGPSLEPTTSQASAIAEAVKAEREACALVAHAAIRQHHFRFIQFAGPELSDVVAAAIRARNAP